ncbi:mitochondrial antiviral-signaling protein [Apteryx mantelli]|uniref:Mitochondrial antiviral-signaling protein n=1 Tax=Apteryx mantelli TaxID=2696672 RepID=A0ABM4EKY2_9AVES
MGFAEDKVYDHILRNLSNFRNIHVTSLAHSLTCLTEADRDELQAREEMRGSHAAVFKFYQYLKCRRGWVTDLINALHQNNAGHLAEELQQLYDLYRVPGGAPGSSASARMPSLGTNPAPGAPMPEQPRRDLPAGGQPLLLPRATTADSLDAASMDLDSRAPVQESLPKEPPEREGPPPPPPSSAACDGASDGLRGEEQGRDWPSRQQHPVCVDNGYFGNANHLNRGGGGSTSGLGRSLVSRDPGAARRNEPEEVHYVSSELPPRPAEATPLQPPDLPKTPQTRPACGSGHGEPSGSFMDVRNPLLIQKQFDAEQKRLGMLGDRGGDGAAPPGSAPAPTGTYTSSGASLKPPLQEGKALEGQRAGSAPSVPTTEKVGDLSLPGGRLRLVQILTIRFLAGAFFPSRCLPKVLPASAAPFLGTAVAGGLEDAAGRRSSPESHGGAEEDEEFSKPGVLLSMVEESPAVAGRCRSLREPSTPYSGDSDRLELSSDPLMLSTDSSSPGSASLGRWSPAPAARADPREEEATGASSRPPPNQDTSLGTHEVRVDHYPSVLLGAPQDLPERDNPFGNPPAFDSSTSSNSSQAKVPPRDSSGSSLSYIAPAAGIALISAVAFLVYARLQK